MDRRATNDAEITRLLRMLYPTPLRNAGIGGTVTLWLFVSKDGRVERTRVQESSGYETLDRAANVPEPPRPGGRTWLGCPAPEPANPLESS